MSPVAASSPWLRSRAQAFPKSSSWASAIRGRSLVIPAVLLRRENILIGQEGDTSRYVRNHRRQQVLAELLVIGTRRSALTLFRPSVELVRSGQCELACGPAIRHRIVEPSASREQHCHGFRIRCFGGDVGPLRCRRRPIALRPTGSGSVSLGRCRHLFDAAHGSSRLDLQRGVCRGDVPTESGTRVLPSCVCASVQELRSRRSMLRRGARTCRSSASAHRSSLRRDNVCKPCSMLRRTRRPVPTRTRSSTPSGTYE